MDQERDQKTFKIFLQICILSLELQGWNKKNFLHRALHRKTFSKLEFQGWN